jgi:signal transduction histidine kinase
MINLRKSIFLKMLFVVFITGILVLLFIAIFFGMMFHKDTRDAVGKNLRNYADYIISDIGIPPDTLKAREISKNFNIDIRYEGKDIIWATSDKLPAIDEVDGSASRHRFRFKPMWLQYVIVTNPDGSRFLFQGNFGRWLRMYRELFFALVILISLVLITAYYFIHRILRPIRRLTDGVKQISLGDFNTQIPIIRQDEVGKLTEAFNNMTHKIKEMLKRRDQLLLDVSHELRSPVTRIKVALEFIPEGKQKDLILTDLLEIEKMITEILETERSQGGYIKLDLKDHDLVKLVKEVKQEYKGQKPGIHFNPVDKDLYLKIDKERIKTVFRNIFENAIKFSKPKSKPVQILIIEDGNELQVNIKDDGIGIPEEELENIFEPFYRVDKSRSKKTGGYGLGLALCKKIMEAHGGSIHILNNKEGGLTVELRFISK